VRAGIREKRMAASCSGHQRIRCRALPGTRNHW